MYTCTPLRQFLRSKRTWMNDDIKENQTDLDKITALETQRRLLNDEYTALNAIPAINRNQYRKLKNSSKNSKNF